MEHRQIELFLAIAERLNMSQAAEAMNITQPGLSKSMHRLQRELGTKLYDRRGRGIELTEAGRALQRHGKVIEGQLADAHTELTGIASGILGHVRIGAGPSWLSRYLPESIANIIKLHPKLRFTVKAGFADGLVGQLRRGELDVVIGALPENRTDPDLRFVRLTADSTHVIGRLNHPLLAKQKRVLSDYTSYGWVLPARQEAMQQRLLRVFKVAGQNEPVTVVEAGFAVSDFRNRPSDRLPEHGNFTDAFSRRSARYRADRSRSIAIFPRGRNYHAASYRSFAISEIVDSRVAAHRSEARGQLNVSINQRLWFSSQEVACRPRNLDQYFADKNQNRCDATDPTTSVSCWPKDKCNGRNRLHQTRHDWLREVLQILSCADLGSGSRYPLRRDFRPEPYRSYAGVGETP